MSGLSVAGIASGIDSDSIISQMVALETRSIAKLQQRIALEEAERVTFEDINARLEALKGATDVFSSDSLFASLSAVSSDTSLIGVSATDAAPRGTHKIRVIQNALAHRIGGMGIEDPLSTVLTDNFTVTAFGGGTALSAVESGSKSSSNADGSDFSADDAVTLSGTYNDPEQQNRSIVVEITKDYDPGANTVSFKISMDGGQTFESYSDKAVAGDGTITLDAGTYFEGKGISLTMDVSNGGGAKDGDSFMFRARAKASLEFQIGDTGERKEILFETEDSLSEIIRKINDDSDLGIRADVLNDGSPSNPFRLILTSLTEGRTGEIQILNNGTDIELEGLNVEEPHSDSLTYTGAVSVAGNPNDLGNSSIIVEMIAGGDFNDARFRISTDGGFTFHDNNGDGFSFTDDGNANSLDLALDELLQDDGITKVFEGASGLTLNMTDDGSEFSVGDRISLDVFNSEIQSAQDALININGINLVKSSNTVDDVFEGLTLDLKGADPDKTVTVIVSEKSGDITASLGAFVEQYNSVMSVLHAQSKFNPEEDDNAPLLMGDATIRQVQTSLQRYVSSRISVLGADSLSSLGDLGITTDSKTGQLNFDTARLSSALSEDPLAVRRVLSRFGDVLEGNNATFVGSTSATKAGTYTVDVTQARTRAQSIATNAATKIVGGDGTIQLSFIDDGRRTNLQVVLPENSTVNDQLAILQDTFDNRDLDVTVFLDGDNKINIRHNQYGSNFAIEAEALDANGALSGFATGISALGDPYSSTQFSEGTDLEGKFNGIDVKSDGDVLIGKDGFAFEDLRIRVSNDFVGEAGKLRLNDGLGSSFSNLLDSFVSLDGILAGKINSFDSTISRLDQQISRVNERASLLETRLKKQFVNLEVTLGRLNATGEYLTQQLKTLPGVQSKK